MPTTPVQTRKPICLSDHALFHVPPPRDQDVALALALDRHTTAHARTVDFWIEQRARYVRAVLERHESFRSFRTRFRTLWGFRTRFRTRFVYSTLGAHAFGVTLPFAGTGHVSNLGGPKNGGVGIATAAAANGGGGYPAPGRLRAPASPAQGYIWGYFCETPNVTT